MKLLFFDLETTGFRRQFDSIIEIAAILVDTETGEQGPIFHEYIKPKKKIPVHITEITGITNEQVKNCRRESEVMTSFVEYINKCNPEALVGHNIDSFDVPWIREKAEFYFLVLKKIPTIDTLKLARKVKAPFAFTTKTGRPSYRQESIAKAMGIEYDAHSAIADVMALITIYGKLTAREKDEKGLIKKEKINKSRRKLGF